jgi:hypothetical protein
MGIAFVAQHSSEEDGTTRVINEGFGGMATLLYGVPNQFPELLSIVAERFPEAITFDALHAYIGSFVDTMLIPALSIQSLDTRVHFQDQIIPSVWNTVRLMLTLLLRRSDPPEGDEGPSVAWLDDARRRIHEFQPAGGLEQNVRDAAVSRAASIAEYVEKEVVPITEFLRDMTRGYYSAQASVADFGVPTPDYLQDKKLAVFRGLWKQELYRESRDVAGLGWGRRFQTPAGWDGVETRDRETT